MNKDQDVAIDLFKSNGDPKESRKQGRRCAKAPIFGRYKIHFWDERHGLLPFLGSLGVSSVILLAINYVVLSPSTPPGPFSLCLSPCVCFLRRRICRVPSILRDDPGRDSRTTYRRKFSLECRVSWHIHFYPPSDVEKSHAGILTLKLVRARFRIPEPNCIFVYGRHICKESSFISIIRKMGEKGVFLPWYSVLSIIHILTYEYFEDLSERRRRSKFYSSSTSRCVLSYPLWIVYLIELYIFSVYLTSFNIHSFLYGRLSGKYLVHLCPKFLNYFVITRLWALSRHSRCPLLTTFREDIVFWNHPHKEWLSGNRTVFRD